MPSTPSTAVTRKTVIHLPDHHPTWGWNAQPCTVSYSLACRDGWGDQVYDRLLDWARTHGLIVDDKEVSFGAGLLGTLHESHHSFSFWSFPERRPNGRC